MMAFPCMLVNPAEKAGIKVPEDPDNFDKQEFPHFYVFCFMQLGRRMPFPDSHWNNAHIIASIPEENIRLVLPEQLLMMGYE